MYKTGSFVHYSVPNCWSVIDTILNERERGRGVKGEWERERERGEMRQVQRVYGEIEVEAAWCLRRDIEKGRGKAVEIEQS